MFKERLRKYRSELHLKKKEMVDKLELGPIDNAEDIFDQNNNPVDLLWKLLIKALKKDIEDMMDKDKLKY